MKIPDTPTCPECKGTGYVLDGFDGTLCQNEFHRNEGVKEKINDAN